MEMTDTMGRAIERAVLVKDLTDKLSPHIEGVDLEAVMAALGALLAHAVAFANPQVDLDDKLRVLEPLMRAQFERSAQLRAKVEALGTSTAVN